MNLRQKVKQAKKDLVLIDEKFKGDTTLDIWMKYEEKEKLNKIIDYKRKPHKYIHPWNESADDKLKGLTYISFRMNYEELCKLETPNGRLITPRELYDFIMKCHDKLYHQGTKVASWSKDETKFNYADYEYYMSDSKTKQKKIYSQKAYRQFYGEDKIYPFNVKKQEENAE